MNISTQCFSYEALLVMNAKHVAITHHAECSVILSEDKRETIGVNCWSIGGVGELRVWIWTKFWFPLIRSFLIGVGLGLQTFAKLWTWIWPRGSGHTTMDSDVGSPKRAKLV